MENIVRKVDAVNNNMAPTKYVSNEDKHLTTEFVIENEPLQSTVLDLLSIDKWYYHQTPKQKLEVSGKGSRHMTTDTTTILGFLTLGK